LVVKEVIDELAPRTTSTDEKGGRREDSKLLSLTVVFPYTDFVIGTTVLASSLVLLLENTFS